MVKNTKGGSGHKGQARKHSTNNTKNDTKTRIAIEDGEVYAQVTKNMGNGMCHVLCQDDKTRLCFIRGKFSGRGKRDNMITNGKWVLIGLRDYESVKPDKLQKCDLLEVYTDQDKDKLRAKVPEVDWRRFLDNDSANSFTDKLDGELEFMHQGEEDYLKLMTKDTTSIDKNTPLKTLKLTESEEADEEIDINDI